MQNSTFETGLSNCLIFSFLNWECLNESRIRANTHVLTGLQSSFGYRICRATYCQSHVLQRRLGSCSQCIMGNLRAFSRSVSFMRGLLRTEHVCDKEIWKLSKDKTVTLQYFKKIAQHIYVAILILTRLLQLQVYVFKIACHLLSLLLS